MPVHKILLWVMLASLGVAAALGAYSALTAHPETVYRIIGSLILAAICSGLLLLSTRRMSDTIRVAAGITGAMLVLIEFVLGMAAIWNLARDEQTAELMGAILMTGLPSVFFVRLLNRRSARVAGWAGLSVAAATLGCWLVAIYGPSYPAENHWFENGWSIAWMGLMATGALAGVETDRRYWRWIGIACAVAACYGLIRVHGFDHASEPLPLLIALAAVAADANLVLRAPVTGGQRWLVYATVAAAIACAATINAEVYANHYGFGSFLLSDDYGRVAAATGILAGCGNLAVAVLARLNSKSEPPPSPMLKSSVVALDCPACGRRLSVGKERASCGGCGLLISVKLEEPRCQACGYSLLMLQSDHCPECGAAVRSAASPSVSVAPSV